MEQIVLKADKDICEINGWQSNTGEVNARTLSVDLSEDLLACDNQFVTFGLADGTEFESQVKDGKADIPEFDKAQFIKIGVYTSDIEGDKCIKRYSPKPTNVYVNTGSYSGNGTEAPIPTAGTFEELLDEIENIVIDTNNIENGAVTIDKVDKNLFYKGVQCASSVNINLARVQNGKQIELKATIKKDAITTDEVSETFFVDGVKCVDSDSIKFAKVQDGKAVSIKAYVKNEVKKITTESTDEERPTAKAVVDYVNTVIGGIENGSY